MRVLHISSGNLYGGVETLLVTLARCRNLCPEMEPEFALSFDGRLSCELTDSGVDVHILGAVRTSRPWTIWRARKRLATLLTSKKFDAIICHMPWPLAVFGSTARTFAPLVFWMHDFADGRHWLQRWAKTVKPNLAICNSFFTASSLANLFPGTPLEVVTCPVVLSPANQPSEQRAALRRSLQANPETVVVIQVSRMEDWKGHALHLQGLARLKDQPDWICWFVGGAQRPQEQRYLSELRQLADDLGIRDRVLFLGQRCDVSQLLTAADIFCQPNKGPEPFGIAFIEALNAGLPVVTCAIGGALEIIDDSCGMLVESNSPAALGDALRKLITVGDRRAKFRVNGPVRADVLCNPATQLTKLSEVLAAKALGIRCSLGRCARDN